MKNSHIVLIASNRKELCLQLETGLKNEGHNVLILTNIEKVFKEIADGEISLTILDFALMGDGRIFARHPLSPQTIPERDKNFTLGILRGCCGNIEFTGNVLKGNVELIFYKDSEIGDVLKKIITILKRLDPFIYKKIEQEEELNNGLESREIVGNSASVKEVFKFVQRVANKKIDVLIMGETGTGKDLVAKAIHELSNNINRAFVSLNCAAIPATLVESEIFGHEQGAFTGAIKRRIGKLELADGGILFLDEIGDMNLEVQAKLLRAIESKEFTKVGGDTTIYSDVRIISATNKYLPKEICEGNFREDLFYRLNVASIVVAPLRERKEDIPLLVNHFIKKYRHEVSSKVEYVSPEALSILLGYHWPGNIRELKNSIQRAMVYCDHETILPEHLPGYLLQYNKTKTKRDFHDALAELVQQTNISEIPENLLTKIEDSLLPDIYKKTGCNKKKTASILGLAINTLKCRLEKYQAEKKRNL